MISILSGIVGPKLARPVLYGLAAALVLVVLFALSRCNRDTTAERQAEQTTASSEAISNAAKDAIGTIENRTVTEKDIDRATAIAQFEIEAAADPDAVRAAVVRAVCSSPAHRSDASCKVR